MTINDKRSEKRTRVLIPGRAYDLAKSNVVKCTVRNASKTGCMIVASDVIGLPEQILLEVDNIDGARKGRIIWRNKMSAGVQFV